MTRVGTLLILVGLLARALVCYAFTVGQTKARNIRAITPIFVASNNGEILTKKNVGEERWDTRFERIKNFIREEGHSIPNVAHLNSEIRLLGIWARNQRMQYNYRQSPDKKHLSFLTERRIALLNSVGFLWNVRPTKWDQKYQELVEFKNRFGHCKVPSNWSENIQLGSWCTQQRQKYKKAMAGTMTTKSGRPLTVEQIHLLDKIGFAWHPGSTVWWKGYQSLLMFKERFGHCDVPQNWKEDIYLGCWVRNQKRACREYVLTVTIEGTIEGVVVSGLNTDRVAALRKLDFCWLPDPKRGYEEPPEDIFKPRQKLVSVV